MRLYLYSSILFFLILYGILSPLQAQVYSLWQVQMGQSPEAVAQRLKNQYPKANIQEASDKIIFQNAEVQISYLFTEKKLAEIKLRTYVDRWKEAKQQGKAIMDFLHHHQGFLAAYHADSHNEKAGILMEDRLISYQAKKYKGYSQIRIRVSSMVHSQWAKSYGSVGDLVSLLQSAQHWKQEN